MEFRVLGPVQALYADLPVDLGGRKQRLVLAVLLLEPNHLVPVGRLVDLLWRDAPPSSARRIVQAHVSRLRTMLARAGDGASLIRRGPGYILCCDPYRIDAHCFQELVERAGQTGDAQARAWLLRQALALWRGPVIADAANDDVRVELCRGLGEARVTAYELWYDAELSLGNHTRVVDELADLSARHPGRQRLTAQLMLAMHRSGRTAQALHEYAAARQRLGDDLGLEPSAELQRLHLAILRADPELEHSRKIFKISFGGMSRTGPPLRRPGRHSEGHPTQE